MIRRLRKNDLKNVLEIWLNTNILAHSFIDESYWKNNLKLIEKMLPKAEVYVYELENKILGFIRDKRWIY